MSYIRPLVKKASIDRQKRLKKPEENQAEEGEGAESQVDHDEETDVFQQAITDSNHVRQGLNDQQIVNL